MFVIRHNNSDCKCTRDYSERCQVLSEQVHSQYFSGCRYISMEGVAIDNLKKLKLSTIPMSYFHFHSHLSDESDQCYINTATYL